MAGQRIWVVYGLRLKGTTEIRYVGYAIKDYTKRLSDHFRDARNGKRGSRFSWIRKHGPDSIESVILEEGIIGDFEYLCYLERYWEVSLRGFGNRLLNDKPCGVGFPPQIGESNPMYGRNHTQESKDKIKATRKLRGLDDPDKAYWAGRNLTQESKDKLRQKALGRKASDETKARMSATRKGVSPSEKARRNMSAGLMGHYVSDETKRKISEARKKNPGPANHIRWHERRDIFNESCSYCLSLTHSPSI
jgi:hypothetical protein